MFKKALQELARSMKKYYAVRAQNIASIEGGKPNFRMPKYRKVFRPGRSYFAVDSQTPMGEHFCDHVFRSDVVKMMKRIGKEHGLHSFQELRGNTLHFGFMVEPRGADSEIVLPKKRD
ncbi:MAG: hypothetical protein ABIG96_03720 [Candidatus Micrarchaeota archaeon]